MDRHEITAHLEKALGTLKDFQRSTVDVVFEQLYGNNVRSMLVADEVGLGKTVVAKGLLAKILLQREEENRRRPFKVTYICSNQVIAKENLRKLHLFEHQVETSESISRISYLAQAPREAEKNGKRQLLQINTLTPATSFQISNSSGMQWERALIYGLLCKDSWLRRKENRKGLGWLLKDGVERMDRFRQNLAHAAGLDFRPDLPEVFLAAIRDEMVPLECEWVYRHFGDEKERTLYQAVSELCRQLKNRNTERARHWACIELAKRLRKILIHCCLEYVDADLYILDEFQRFQDLIDDDIEKEQALIANKIFGKRGAKILLLSATPFKAFTGHSDHENGEEHFTDFRRVLTFLLDNNPAKLEEYDTHRSALYRQLLTLRPGQCELTSEHRQKIENILRSRICRTERHIVGEAGNSLIQDSWKLDRLPFGAGDIRNFTLTDAVVRALEKVTTVNGKPVEFCKSALYPFSFLERYQLKEKLKAHIKDKGVRQALLNSRAAWVDLHKVDDYSWKIDSEGNADGPSNARLKLLTEKALGIHGAEMLWIPPSLPYYQLEKSFGADQGFTKTLLFSSWVMVPRMVSTLLSYEVEQRTIGNPNSKSDLEKGDRLYFKKDRNPAPQITFEAREDRQMKSMSNFTLLYPSQSLAAAILPKLNLKENLPLAKLKAAIKKQIQSMIDDLGLRKYVKRSIGGERWYWAAPLLLDREQPHLRSAVERWAADDNNDWGRETFFDTRGKEPGIKEEHADEFVRCFHDPDSIDFGPMPKDLADVLADLALGSPAVLTLRSLQQLFPQEEVSKLMVHAFKVADQFCELFNKPESIAAVRLSSTQDPYWRMVADYSAAGCLQAVLDEYLHLLKGQNLDLEKLMEQLLKAINLTSASIKVDSLETFLSDSKETKSMRCHYATTFGNQDFDRESGQNRATGIREVFNSPFRPFVLASTSIGQEGLDFHSYCRRIVHWNLPSNPIDLEQREGRINRYKSLVIRQHLAKKYRDSLAGEITDEPSDTWEQLFALAEKERDGKSTCELVPYWHTDTDEYKIERVIPSFPFSQDEKRLERILKTLAIYRLAFGQPRQEELVEHLLARGFSESELMEIRENLIVNLCPISYMNGFDNRSSGPNEKKHELQRS